MPIVDYPFIDINGDGAPKPALPVKLINPANGFEHTTWALIDTGADYTVIPEFIAKQLYHDIKHHNVKRDMFTGIGGNAVVYYHTFHINILKSSKKGKVYRKSIIELQGTFAVVQDLFTMVLGEKDFLSKYILIIDYPKKTFSVRKP